MCALRVVRLHLSRATSHSRHRQGEGGIAMLTRGAHIILALTIGLVATLAIGRGCRRISNETPLFRIGIEHSGHIEERRGK